MMDWREQIAKALYGARPFCIASTPTTFGAQVARSFDWDGAPAYYQEDMRQLADAVLAIPELAERLNLQPIQPMPTFLRGDETAATGGRPNLGISENG